MTLTPQFRIEQPEPEQTAQEPARNLEVTQHTPTSGDALKFIALAVGLYLVYTMS